MRTTRAHNYFVLIPHFHQLSQYRWIVKTHAHFNSDVVPFKLLQPRSFRERSSMPQHSAAQAGAVLHNAWKQKLANESIGNLFIYMYTHSLVIIPIRYYKAWAAARSGSLSRRTLECRIVAGHTTDGCKACSPNAMEVGTLGLIVSIVRGVFCDQPYNVRSQHIQGDTWQIIATSYLKFSTSWKRIDRNMEIHFHSVKLGQPLACQWVSIEVSIVVRCIVPRCFKM